MNQNDEQDVVSLRHQHMQEIQKNALKHYEACKVGIPCFYEDYQVCQCCHQVLQKDPIPLTQNTKQFQIFGFGYPLYYSFLKYCIMLILVLIATRTGVLLYMATKQNYKFCYGSGITGLRSSLHGHDAKPKHLIYDQQSNHFLSLRHGSENNVHFKLQHQQQIVPVYNPYSTNSNPLSSTSVPQATGKQVASGQKTQTKQTKAEQGSKSQNEQQKKEKKHSISAGQHAQCTSFMVYFSLFKGQQEYDNFFLRILAFLIHLTALIGIRNLLLKQDQYYDQRTCSLSDYSLMISNLPDMNQLKQLVRKLIRQKFNKQKEIRQMLFVFHDERVQQLQKDLKSIQQKQLQAIQSNNDNQKRQQQQKYHLRKQQFKKDIQIIKQRIQDDRVRCDKIIIIFNSQADKGQVLSQYQQYKKNKQDLTKVFFQNQHQYESRKNQASVVIKQAPQPNQIVWQNIDISDAKRRLRILRGWLMTFAFLALTTLVFYFILVNKTQIFVKATQLQKQNPNNPQIRSKKNFATFLVFAAIFGVIMFNKFIMGKVLHKFVHMEKHAFTDKQGFSFSMKYSLGMFFTTALMTLAVEALTYKNFNSHHFGVIEQETIMFFLTAFLIPLIWLIHPYNLFKKLQYMISKDKLMTQQQANQLIEDFPYDLGKRYAQIFEIMWFTFLYSELIPFGSFLIFIGLILYYWVDKYNFLRRSTIKQGLGGKISGYSMRALDATLFLTQAGRVLFSYLIQSQVDGLSLILMGLGLLYLFVPIVDLIYHFNEEKFMIESTTYDKSKYRFKETYKSLHPVYKLVYEEDIQNHRRKVMQYYKQQMKNVKLYGAGRGIYASKNHIHSHSNIQSSRVIDDNSMSNSRRQRRNGEKI